MADHKKVGFVKGYSWYVVGFIVLAAFIIIFALVIIFLGEATLSYSVALGGLISGFVGLLVVFVQELQTKNRGARVFFHIWNTPKYLNKENGFKSYPLILRNQGSLPGREIQCFLTVTANKGNYRFSNQDKWSDVTDIQGGFDIQTAKEKNTKILSRNITTTVYPKSATGEYYIGFIEIEPDAKGQYDIDINSEVQESFGVTSRKCKLTEADEKIENPCGPENNFRSYY